MVPEEFYVRNDSPGKEENDDQAQGMVEYALIVGLVSILVISIFVSLGPVFRNMLTDSVDQEAVGESQATVSSSVY